MQKIMTGLFWKGWFSVLFFIAVFSIVSMPAQAQLEFPRWRWSNPNPFGANIQDIARQEALHLAVGERGQLFALDALSELWRPYETGVKQDLRAVEVFQGNILVVGESGTILSGESPASLQYIDLGTLDWLEDLAVGSNNVVAVGDNAAIYSSTDGIEWNRHIVSFDHWLRSVAYSPELDLFAAVGRQGLIATSANGSVWMEATSPTSVDLNRIAWLNDRFWAVGDHGTIVESLNGLGWNLVGANTSNHLYGVAGNGSTRLVAGENVVSSLNIRQGAWRNETDPMKTYPAPRWTYRTAHWIGDPTTSNGHYLVGGRSGVLAEGNPSGILDTQLDWATSSHSIRRWLWEVFRTPKFYVAVGDRATILTSGNGVDWDLELAPSSLTNAVFLGVGGTTNVLLSVGNRGAVAISPSQLMDLVVTNQDGSTTTKEIDALGVLWYAVDGVPTTNDLQGVTVYESSYVLSGGNGTILTSADGTNWTAQPTPTTAYLSSLAAFDGGIVAVGDQGTILWSTNAQLWAIQSSPVTDWIYRVRFLGGQFVAVGQNGIILTSPNGRDWTRQVSPTARWLNDVALEDDIYYAVGNQGAALISSNAVDWVEIGTVTHKSLYSVAANTEQIVAVGVEGAIVRARTAANLQPVRIASYDHDPPYDLFLIVGEADQRLTLDRKPALDSSLPWESGPLLEIINGSGALIHLQPARTNTPFSREFFRAIVVP